MCKSEGSNSGAASQAFVRTLSTILDPVLPGFARLSQTFINAVGRKGVTKMFTAASVMKLVAGGYFRTSACGIRALCRRREESLRLSMGRALFFTPVPDRRP